MPDYYDVCRLDVESDAPPVPIMWQELPDLEHEDSNNRQVRARNYVNEPRNETYFSLASGYTLPSGWSIRRGGVLRYQAILGQTIAVKYTANRQGVTDVDSNEFSITRTRAFQENLIPNRIVLGLGFNASTQRVYIFNTTDVDINPRQDYVNAFNIEGVEQLTESFESSQGSPIRPSGGCFDGTHWWWCGGNNSRTEAYLNKVNGSGALVNSYTITGNPIYIESLTFDGTYLWGLDARNYQIRKFNLSGVEQSGAITLARASHYDDFDRYNLGEAQWGLAYADDHFWIPQNHFTGGNERIFCCDTSGNRVSSRDIETEHAVAGVTYNPTTDNLWWIYDRTDDEGARYGILEAQQI
ncbi:MAG: hypothetical protein F4118_12385 [Acidimicrobiaceae bacterium]|nr:hypothetical protein [Candidatus Poribacteria bacterium]MYI37201.1 hypothetical protein [Acidimicrobiaceae bacterium]